MVSHDFSFLLGGHFHGGPYFLRCRVAMRRHHLADRSVTSKVSCSFVAVRGETMRHCHAPPACAV